MQELESFLVFIRKFNNLNIPYMTTGSVAGIVYGEPRLTHDIDLVLKIFGDHASQICKAFPPEEFYCPPEEVRKAHSAYPCAFESVFPYSSVFPPPPVK
ncbi:MAG: hypothetical protein WCS96_12530 [Victivallales bacterium]